MKKILWAVALGGWMGVSGWVQAADALEAPAAPAPLQVAATEKLLFALDAQGVQIYQWQAKKDHPTQYEWVFKAPEADLFDGGKKVGHHGAGPTWESTDGSKVVGLLKAHVDSIDSDAVPWLLLTAKSHSGNGIFSHVTSIQRLETSGGKPPTATGHPKPGEELRVPYYATYYFYGSK
jgi:hypothetical protein